MVILYADDDKDDRDLFSEIVLQINPAITVLTAQDGAEALKILSSRVTQPPDIIFLDINMPILDGIETLVEIRRDSRYKGIRVVLYSTADAPLNHQTYGLLNFQFLKKSTTVNDAVGSLSEVILSTKE